MFFLFFSSVCVCVGGSLPGCRIACHTQILGVPSSLTLKTEQREEAISLMLEKREIES